jgi:hypothetical protein
MKFDNDSTNDYEQPAAKTHPARLVGMYDIGVQPGNVYNGEKLKDKPQLILTWELVGKDKTAEGKNFQISQFLTVSLHKKGKLVPVLKTLGAPFKSKSDDWYEIDPKYHISTLLGEPAMIKVSVSDKGKAFVESVMAPVEGMVIGDCTEKLSFLDLDADDYLDQFTKAPKWVQTMCEKSVGWSEK